MTVSVNVKVMALDHDTEGVMVMAHSWSWKVSDVTPSATRLASGEHFSMMKGAWSHPFVSLGNTWWLWWPPWCSADVCCLLFEWFWPSSSPWCASPAFRALRWLTFSSPVVLSPKKEKKLCWNTPAKKNDLNNTCLWWKNEKLLHGNLKS